MKKIISPLLTLLLASSTFALAAPANAVDAPVVSNGDFETGIVGDSVVTGWTSVNDRIDLGVDSIAGCVTVDTSDYSNLRGWDVEYSGPIPNNPVANNDSAILDVELSEGTYGTQLVDGSDLDEGFVKVGKVLGLTSEMDVERGGYVVHGPAFYSDAFTATAIDDISLEWAASENGDDYHVFAYILNVNTCAQTEVIDSTGVISFSKWPQLFAVPFDSSFRYCLARTSRH